MTPFDILRRLEADFSYVPPERMDVALEKVLIAKAALQKIIDAGPMTDAATEALEVLISVRNHEFYIRSLES